MEESKVLAIVEGTEITEKDVELLMRGLGPEQSARFNSEQGKKTLLNELINQQLFYLDAIENGFDKEEGFIKQLEKTKENLLKQYAMTKMLTQVNVDVQEVKDYYEAHKNQFVTQEGVRASHILVDGQEKANNIIKEMNDGLAFEEAAKKYSKCPSNAKGGDLGFFTKGRMVPEFEKVAFDMEKGELSAPVKTQFGYHIIKVVDKKGEEQKSFEEVKTQILNQLKAINQNKLYVDKTSKLRQKYSVEVK